MQDRECFACLQAEGRFNGLADRRCSMSGEVNLMYAAGRQRSQFNVMLQTLQRPAGGAFCRLDPAPAFLAYPHHNAVPRKQTFCGVKVLCLKALPHRFSLAHAGYNARHAGRRNLKF